MEFDSNTSGDKSPDISDEARLEASTRQRTVAPVHDDVVADDLPDELIASQHIIEGPLANIPTDSETTRGYEQQLSSSARHGHHFILSLCLITFAIIIGLAVYILTK